jgi:hypothetical protein
MIDAKSMYEKRLYCTKVYFGAITVKVYSRQKQISR